MKTCTICKEQKEVKDFYTNGLTKVGTVRISSRCKKCDAAYKRPSSGKQSKQSNHRNKLKSWVIEYKKSLSCADCGMSFKDSHWLCDFHHTDPSNKEYPVAGLVGQGMSLVRIEAEISKCVPLCANCHRTRHFKEREEKVLEEVGD